MLFIKSRNNNGSWETHQYIGNIGFKSHLDLKHVEYCTATGEEALVIWKAFTSNPSEVLPNNKACSIPWNYNTDKQTWYGDIAKTILANLS